MDFTTRHEENRKPGRVKSESTSDEQAIKSQRPTAEYHNRVKSSRPLSHQEKSEFYDRVSILTAVLERRVIAFHDSGHRDTDAAELDQARGRSFGLEGEQLDRRWCLDAALYKHAIHSLLGQIRRGVEEVNYLRRWLYSVLIGHRRIQESATVHRRPKCRLRWKTRLPLISYARSLYIPHSSGLDHVSRLIYVGKLWIFSGISGSSWNRVNLKLMLWKTKLKWEIRQYVSRIYLSIKKKENRKCIFQNNTLHSIFMMIGRIRYIIV